MSKIVPGFGRGSKELGIPTANLSRTDMQCTLEFDSLPCGIYWGFARVISSSSSLEEEEKEKGGDGNGQGVRVPSQVYKAAVSIGFNPHYGNAEKTIEPHLIAASNHPLRNASKCKLWLETHATLFVLFQILTLVCAMIHSIVYYIILDTNVPLSSSHS